MTRITSDGVPWDNAEDMRPRGFGVSAFIPTDISADRKAEIVRLAAPLLREMLAVPEKDRLDVLATVVDYYIQVEVDHFRKYLK
jgi:hypothetical protein